MSCFQDPVRRISGEGIREEDVNDVSEKDVFEGMESNRVDLLIA